MNATSNRGVRDRAWFQNAYIRIAALIVAGVMNQMTPRDSVSVIEGQLERAYRRGVADERAGRTGHIGPRRGGLLR